MLNIILPLSSSKTCFSLILNFIFYCSISYNGAVICYCSLSAYVGLSWIIALFSTVSSFILVYGLPFVFKFDTRHVLGRLYILVLGLITLLSTLYIIKAPSWGFLIIILIGLVTFNTSCALSTYFNNLTRLKSLPLKIHYKKFFFNLLKFGSLGIVSGLCVFTFDCFPRILQYVCIYTFAISLLFVSFTYFISFFRSEKKEKKKSFRVLPTAITKLLILKIKNPFVFFDLRIFYLGFITFLRGFPLFVIVFLGVSYFLGVMHIFGYYIVTIIIATLGVSFPNSQKWILETYGPKSLRLLGWNVVSKTAYAAEKFLVYTFVGAVTKTGIETVGSEIAYERACDKKKFRIQEIFHDHSELIKKFGNDSFVRKVLDDKLIQDLQNLPEPTRENTRVRIFDTETLKWIKTTSKVVYDPFGIHSSSKDKKDEE